jgi:SAM-dependent methyltransferase
MVDEERNIGDRVSAPTFDETYFAEHYPDYFRQNPRRKVAWYLEFADSWLRPGPVSHIDVGCGLGALAGFTSETGRFTSYATDISEYAVDVVRQRFPGVDAKVSGADTGFALWPDTAFGLITIMDVLEHLEDPETALLAAKASLAEGGVLLVAVPVYDGFSGPIITRLDSDPTHLHKWGRQAWLDLIGTHFVIHDWTGVFRILPPVGPYVHVPTAWLRRHAPAIVIAAG